MVPVGAIVLIGTATGLVGAVVGETGIVVGEFGTNVAAGTGEGIGVGGVVGPQPNTMSATSINPKIPVHEKAILVFDEANSCDESFILKTHVPFDGANVGAATRLAAKSFAAMCVKSTV